MADNNMIQPIKGENLVVMVGTNAPYHSTSCNINLSANFEDWQTKDSNGKQKVLSGKSGTIQVDGLVAVFGATGAPSGKMDAKALITAFNSGAKVQLAVTVGTLSYTADAWITGVSMTGQVAQNSTYSATFEFEDLEPVMA